MLFRSKIALPDLCEYATGLIFFPQDEKERNFCKGVFKDALREERLNLLGWRSVPVDNTEICKAAKDTQPVIEQIFIASATKRGGSANNFGGKNQIAFERKLFVVRKIIENKIRASRLKEKTFFYITNLSSRTLSYKGLLMPHQLERFFLDLRDGDKRVLFAWCIPAIPPTPFLPGI